MRHLRAVHAARRRHASRRAARRARRRTGATSAPSRRASSRAGSCSGRSWRARKVGVVDDAEYAERARAERPLEDAGGAARRRRPRPLPRRDASLLLPTVRSRCQQVRARPLSDAEASTSFLQRDTESPATSARCVVARADGSPGRALALARRPARPEQRATLLDRLGRLRSCHGGRSVRAGAGAGRGPTSSAALETVGLLVPRRAGAVARRSRDAPCGTPTRRAVRAAPAPAYPLPQVLRQLEAVCDTIRAPRTKRQPRCSRSRRCCSRSGGSSAMPATRLTHGRTASRSNPATPAAGRRRPLPPDGARSTTSIPAGCMLHRDDRVLVETEHGPTLGTVVTPPDPRDGRRAASGSRRQEGRRARLAREDTNLQRERELDASRARTRAGEPARPSASW